MNFCLTLGTILNYSNSVNPIHTVQLKHSELLVYYLTKSLDFIQHQSKGIHGLTKVQKCNLDLPKELDPRKLERGGSDHLTAKLPSMDLLQELGTVVYQTTTPYTLINK